MGEDTTTYQREICIEKKGGRFTSHRRLFVLCQSVMSKGWREVKGLTHLKKLLGGAVITPPPNRNYPQYIKKFTPLPSPKKYIKAWTSLNVRLGVQKVALAGLVPLTGVRQ